MIILDKNSKEYIKIERSAVWINSVRMKKRKELQWNGRRGLTVDENYYIFQKYEGKCMCINRINGSKCFKNVDFSTFAVTHLLPISLFPDKKWDIKNIILICRECFVQEKIIKKNKIVNLPQNILKKLKIKRQMHHKRNNILENYIILEDQADDERDITSEDKNCCCTII